MPEHDKCCMTHERHFDSTGKFSGAFAQARGKTPQCARKTARPDCCAPYGDHARKERRDTSARQTKPPRRGRDGLRHDKCTRKKPERTGEQEPDRAATSRAGDAERRRRKARRACAAGLPTYARKFTFRGSSLRAGREIRRASSFPGSNRCTLWAGRSRTALPRA